MVSVYVLQYLGNTVHMTDVGASVDESCMF